MNVLKVVLKYALILVVGVCFGEGVDGLINDVARAGKLSELEAAQMELAFARQTIASDRCKFYNVTIIPTVERGRRLIDKYKLQFDQQGNLLDQVDAETGEIRRANPLNHVGIDKMDKDEAALFSLSLSKASEANTKCQAEERTVDKYAQKLIKLAKKYDLKFDRQGNLLDNVDFETGAITRYKAPPPPPPQPPIPANSPRAEKRP